MRVSIIIPVFNERQLLPAVLERVSLAPLPEGCEKEVIVMDDASTDGTSELLDFYKATGAAVVHRSPRNFGKGAMIREGMARATGDIVLIQDADLEYNPDDYITVLYPLVCGTADVVYGSRFQGASHGMRWPNWIANRVLTLTANLLFRASITDEATAYKAFRSDVLRAIRLRSMRFEFCPEITAKVLRAGVHIHEVPISYNARRASDGKKIRWYDAFHALYTLFRYRFSPLPSFLDAPAIQASRFTTRRQEGSPVKC
jgi:dolichol-phosphate mannosyltransferase